MKKKKKKKKKKTAAGHALIVYSGEAIEKCDQG
jgi:hypothetical protein